MSNRPMHTQPGAMEALQRLYAGAMQAIQNNDLQTAVAQLTEGLAIDDHYRERYVTMYAQRGFAHQRLGNVDAAIADYTQAITMEPPINQAQYLFHRGMCWSQKEEFERAVEDYGASIALYADHPGPYHLRAKLLVNQLGRYQEALPDLDKLLSMREVPEGLQLRALAKVSLNRHTEAVPDLERAQELQADSYNDYLLAACAAAAGDEQRLAHHMRAALQDNPSFAEYFAQLAEEFAPYRTRPWFKQIVG